ncbi:MAG: winged helix-turn-helix domain-containing protein [Candidatus Afipia apatlaquensis]|jgi:predicted transcriptional regulator|uniref:Winged helix-turn-helix domain-containing protein n=1 Tax=Candidatus Afipia apatlaquensis TaxID=2712852 RepID=A0A7C9RH52_9BRAD|nr:winged helix-turn-helix domain-containing protein [Candidatus Afipia apatlaquensis]
MLAIARSQSDASPSASWTFLTNHAHVLLCLVEKPEARMREVAVRVGITERAVQRIVAELEEAGYLSRMREGRANRYLVHEDLFLRHPVEGHCTIAGLIGMVLGNPRRPQSSRKSARNA